MMLVEDAGDGLYAQRGLRLVLECPEGFKCGGEGGAGRVDGDAAVGLLRRLSGDRKRSPLTACLTRRFHMSRWQVRRS